MITGRKYTQRLKKFGKSPSLSGCCSTCFHSGRERKEEKEGREGFSPFPKIEL